MKKIFHPESVAVIGASVKPEKIGGIIINNLLAAGYQGKIYPVNPKYDQIKELKCYHSLKEIKKNIDLVIIATPAATVLGILDETVGLKNPPKNFIIISAGFAESGAEGQALEKQISDLAQKNKLNIIGPNCLGVINTQNGLNASFANKNFLSGNVGLISQSGAFAVALMDLGKKENLGFSYIATIGNKTVVDEADLLEYFAQDKKTQAVGIYLENIKRGEQFLNILKRTSQQKPIFIVKGGSSPKSQNAILSHTGAMAGDEEVAESLIGEAGGFYLPTTFDLINNLKIFSHFRAPLNNKIAVLTNAGGPGILAADYISQSSDLTLYEFSEQQKNNLKNKIPEASSCSNPIDLRGDADHFRYELALKELAKIKNIGALLVVATAQAQTDIPLIYESLRAAQKYCSFPVIPVVMSAIEQTTKEKMPNFVEPSCAVRALGNYYLWTSRKKTKLVKIVKNKINTARQKQSNHYLEEIKKHGRPILLANETANLGKLYTFNILDSIRTSSANPANLSYPIVLKIDSDKILHKNKEGGLIMGIKNPGELSSAIDQLHTKFPKTDLIIQKTVKPGLELIIGLKNDNNFGSIIMLGLGGIATEILNIKIFFSLQNNLQYIKTKIDTSPLSKILAKQRIKSETVAKEISKAITLASENPSLKEADFNPIIFYPDSPPIAIDFKVVLK
ncbi:hypothetical protein GYA54_00015 [Candidatus Kuenenbacteria bacterium]|nr:hypothetical protein [Candidatus Kuenenbacteria bacterium]